MNHDDTEKIAAARAVLKASVDALDGFLGELEMALRSDAEAGDIFNAYVGKRYERLKHDMAQTRALVDKWLAASDPLRQYN